MKPLTFVLASTLFYLLPSTAASADTTLTVMTYNTQHGGSDGHASVDDIASAIAAQSPRPDIVVLQEIESPTYVTPLIDRLNAAYASATWQGRAAQHCVRISSGTCTGFAPQSVVVLSRFPIVSTDTRYFAQPDYYLSGGRAALRADVELPDGTILHVWSTHLQPNGPQRENFSASRAASVAALDAWARSVPGPKLIGGDFNAAPASAEIAAMSRDFTDAWRAVGTDDGLTHGRNRIDYWFADPSAARVTAAWVGFDPGISDHRPLLATYAIASVPPLSTVTVASTTPSTPLAATGGGTPNAVTTDQFADDFNSATLDPAKWSRTLQGDMQDPTIPLRVTTALEIDPLSNASGWRYNGIVSSLRLDLTNAFASVQLVQAPSTQSAANALFTVGSDSENFYRLFVSGGALYVERRIQSVKTDFGPYPFVNGEYLRIGHDGQDVVFATAADAGRAAPSQWTLLYSEPWDSNVDVTALSIELKAGTSSPEAAPGAVVWDNVRATSAPTGAAPNPR